MNSRDYKMFRLGHYYHIYNRGDNKENIFITPEDYLAFLERLRVIFGLVEPSRYGRRGEARVKPLPKDSFTILAYCLMPNHYHFVIKQNTEIPISTLITKLCTSYAKYFNKKYHRVGNLFQDTFKAKIVETDEYLAHLSAYVHANPINALEYPYSSLPEYTGKKEGFCDTKIVLEYFSSIEEYLDIIKNYNKAEEHKIKTVIFNEFDNS